ncbi:MAG: thioesterase superfamily protein [Frankiales bacterium]|nr:thioesterase superfamily protein [Frankiales bacterium]
MGDPAEQGGAAYGQLIEEARGFLNALAAARPEEADILELTASIAAWREKLEAAAVPESEQLFARRIDLPGRGQVMAPVFHQTERTDTSFTGTVRFGRYFLGSNGAAHGGAISLVFDELLGRFSSNVEGALARTAYLHVNYRSVTPIDTDLQLRARLVKHEGRKFFITGEITNGDVVCADAECLFVQLRPGQP